VALAEAAVEEAYKAEVVLQASTNRVHFYNHDNDFIDDIDYVVDDLVEHNHVHDFIHNNIAHSDPVRAL